MWEPEEESKVNKFASEKGQKGNNERNPHYKRRSKMFCPKDIKPRPRDPKAKTIECLVAKNGLKYLVKWATLSEDENTWEHKANIPKHVIKVKQNLMSKLSLQTGVDD